VESSWKGREALRNRRLLEKQNTIPHHRKRQTPVLLREKRERGGNLTHHEEKRSHTGGKKDDSPRPAGRKKGSKIKTRPAYQGKRKKATHPGRNTAARKSEVE